jgi:hypothetical protein
MISCLLTHVTRNPQGLPIYKESAITGESIQIGRGAACKVHLLDHRVNLLHATVKRSEDGTLYIDGENDAILNINGFFVQSAALAPGTRIEIGPYLFIVEPAPDVHDIALSVEMLQPLPGQDTADACQTAPVTFAALGLSKRKLGFGWAAGILFLFLLLPLLPGVFPALDKWQSTLPVTLAESWNAGPFSGGHGAFGAKCSICHQRAFRAISDDACAGCHKQVAEHLAKNDSHESAFKNVRCTDCHRDHLGKAGLAAHDSSICVTCHGDIKRKDAARALADVRDFGADHPSFHLTFPDGKKIVRVRQDEKDKLAEKPELKLNHQLHLDKNGLSSPQGVSVMVCRDCHKIEESGTHFAPMTMKKTCQQSGCHTQYFTEPVFEVVLHGSERGVLDRLRVSYAKWLADSPAEKRASCGLASDAGTKHTLDCANDLAQKYAATFFKENLECGQCHETEPSGNKEVPWKIVPLHLNRDYQPGAVFPHFKHDTIDCAGCHDKENSKSSTEIAMPTIEKCRECHGGERSVKRKIGSACDSCHRFHRGERKGEASAKK